MKSTTKFEAGFRQVLEALHEEYGLDISDPNFYDTPKRAAKAYAEIFSGLEDTEEQIKRILADSFPCKYKGMVTERRIRVFSMCPHHLLPVELFIDVAYIPSAAGHVLGLSKLPRIVELLAKRPVLQEQLTEDITKTLSQVKGVQGAACVVRGKHYCMAMRGIKQPDTETLTSSLTGVFSSEDATRAEFYTLIGGYVRSNS